MELHRKPYGTTPEGNQIDAYTLTNSAGIRVGLITYGCIITSVQTPDKNGKIGEITLGFDSLDGYLPRHPYFGALVGPARRHCRL